MSKYVISDTSGESYDPYKPLMNMDLKTGQPIDDSNQLKEKRGPFFSCNGTIHEPHFHQTNRHPTIDEELKGQKLKFEQLHVPGYDEHDGYTIDPKADPFHVITGWHITIPGTNGIKDTHFYQFHSTRKFPDATDNDDALSSWKDHVQQLFGSGDFEERKLNTGSPISTSAYMFHPHNDVNNNVINFTPRVELDGKVFGAMEITNANNNAPSEKDAKEMLMNYTNACKESSQKGMENKTQQDPSYWNDKFKTSGIIYTLGENDKLLGTHDYDISIVRHGSKCICGSCTQWSNKDFEG